tara:strand:+ start:520 stop:837 length:318 start_codon:yes stop_codon:yes gene_type:complete
MTPDKIKQRTVYKQSKKLEDRASFQKFSRRDTNNTIKQEDHPNDVYEDFFEFEENLNDLKSASEQYAEQENKNIAQQNNDANFNDISEDNVNKNCIIMERIYESE